jgi:hypothetical protein
MEVIVDSRLRAAERSWFEEFDELEADGYLWRCDHNCTIMHTTACSHCGEVMEVRLFERRDIAYRAYALCVVCGWWVEL